MSSILLFALSLSALCLINNYYREPLFSASLTFIPAFQSAFSDYHLFFTVLTDLGAEFLCGGMLLVAYVFTSRKRALYYMFNFMVMNFASAFLKLRGHEPRPFWVDSKVAAIRCSNEYGSPSGHSSTSMHITMAVTLDIAEELHMPTIGKVMSSCAGIGLPILIGISRLYVGVHSLDQVLFGWSIGMWCSILCHFEVRNRLMKSCDDLKASLISNDKRQLIAVLVVLLDLITVSALLAQYYYTKLTFTDPPSWLQMYESKCPKHTVTNFSDGSLYFGGVSFFFFGAYLSFIMLP